MHGKRPEDVPISPLVQRSIIASRKEARRRLRGETAEEEAAEDEDNQWAGAAAAEAGIKGTYSAERVQELLQLLPASKPAVAEDSGVGGLASPRGKSGQGGGSSAVDKRLQLPLKLLQRAVEGPAGAAAASAAPSGPPLLVAEVQHLVGQLKMMELEPNALEDRPWQVWKGCSSTGCHHSQRGVCLAECFAEMTGIAISWDRCFRYLHVMPSWTTRLWSCAQMCSAGHLGTGFESQCWHNVNLCRDSHASRTEMSLQI
jgi:hypothetical protein